MAEVKQEMRKKHLNYLFLNTGTKETPAWVRVSKSTDFAIAYNGETEVFDYIANENPTTELQRYSPSIPQTQKAIIGDGIYDFIADMARKQKTGLDAVVQAMIVRQQKDSSGKNLAETFNALLTIDTDDFVAGTITYTIAQRGDVTLGTATVAEGKPTFTADAQA